MSNLKKLSAAVGSSAKDFLMVNSPVLRRTSNIADYFKKPDPSSGSKSRLGNALGGMNMYLLTQTRYYQSILGLVDMTKEILKKDETEKKKTDTETKKEETEEKEKGTVLEFLKSKDNPYLKSFDETNVKLEKIYLLLNENLVLFKKMMKIQEESTDSTKLKEAFGEVGRENNALRPPGGFGLIPSTEASGSKTGEEKKESDFSFTKLIGGLIGASFLKDLTKTLFSFSGGLLKNIGLKLGSAIASFGTVLGNFSKSFGSSLMNILKSRAIWSGLSAVLASPATWVVAGAALAGVLGYALGNELVKSSDRRDAAIKESIISQMQTDYGYTKEQAESKYKDYIGDTTDPTKKTYSDKLRSGVGTENKSTNDGFTGSDFVIKPLITDDKSPAINDYLAGNNENIQKLINDRINIEKQLNAIDSGSETEYKPIPGKEKEWKELNDKRDVILQKLEAAKKSSIIDIKPQEPKMPPKSEQKKLEILDYLNNSSAKPTGNGNKGNQSPIIVSKGDTNTNNSGGNITNIIMSNSSLLPPQLAFNLPSMAH